MRSPSAGASALSNIVAGVITALLAIAGSVCAASFIFSGELAIFLPTGIGIALISSIIIIGVLSFKGSFYGTIGSAAIIPSVLIGIMAQSIFDEMEKQTSIFQTINTILPTILVAIIIVSVSTGIFFYLMGRYKVGSLVRFIPFPVMGGFLAGVGWLMVEGSINVMRRVPISIEHTYSYIFNTPTLIYIVPGILFAVILLLVQLKVSHYMVLPTMILGAIGLFYVALWQLKMPISQAVEQGWLIESFSNKQVWASYDFSTFGHVKWGILASRAGDLVGVLCVSIISLLLTATGIEAATNSEIDIDQDLRCAGIGNIIAGLLGGVVGYHFILFSQANYKAGARTRFPALLASLFLALVAVFGASYVICYVPKFVFGGMLLFFGLNLLVEWVYSSYFKFSKIDYGLTLVIFSSIIFFGFLKGILLGVALSMGMFVVKYARIEVVRHVMSGSDKRSNVERSLREQKVLHDIGGKICIVTLQGFIFFGTAYNLYQVVRKRVSNADLVLPKYFVFDFRLVNGQDSSAGHNLQKIAGFLRQYESHIIFSGVDEATRKQIKNADCIEMIDGQENIFDDLDHAVEWCEDLILNAEYTELAQGVDIRKIVMDWFANEGIVDAFVGYLEKKEVLEGETLFKQGDPSDSIYILEQGASSI
ncbi:MAG: SulP family sulfate permease, partial [Candidatus Marinamargulisbacteria bacterium]